MKRPWTDKYVGIPFKEGGRGFDGCDCGGLVILVLREEFGIKAADFNAYSAGDFASMAGYGKLAQGIDDLMSREWPVVEKPRPFDLLRFRYGRHPAHVGLYAGLGKFLHVEEAGSVAKLTTMSSPVWRPRFIEYRRHRNLEK